MDLSINDVQTWLMTNAGTDDLKLIQDLCKTKLRMELRVGDPVLFDGKRQGIIHGTVSKINHKTVKVQTPLGLWNVSIDFLIKD